jgi:hypothetical protein
MNNSYGKAKAILIPRLAKRIKGPKCPSFFLSLSSSLLVCQTNARNAYEACQPPMTTPVTHLLWRARALRQPHAWRPARALLSARAYFSMGLQWVQSLLGSTWTMCTQVKPFFLAPSHPEYLWEQVLRGFTSEAVLFHPVWHKMTPNCSWSRWRRPTKLLQICIVDVQMVLHLLCFVCVLS